MRLRPAKPNRSCFRSPAWSNWPTAACSCGCEPTSRRNTNCYSRDRGEHWSEPRPGPLISAPYSPASIKRIPWTGHLLCVWNDHSGRHPYPNKANRTPLCLAVSPDDGLTWTPSQVIESDQDGSYCYTSITFYDHRAILSYCAGDSKIGRLNRLKVLAIPRRLLQSLEHGM